MSLKVTLVGRAILWRLYPKQGGGTRNENCGFERSRWDLSIGTLLGVCTIHLLPIEDRASLLSGYSADGVRSTVGPRNATVSVWEFFVVLRVLYISYKALLWHADKLADRDGNVWNVAHKYEYFTFTTLSATSPYFSTPPAFSFQHLVRQVCYTKPSRDTLTNMPIGIDADRDGCRQGLKYREP